MAGYTLAQMKRFAELDKKKTTRRPLRQVRDALVKEKGKVNYYVWGNRVATLSPKKKTLSISDAGWKSKLTKQRLNKVIPTGNISQKKGQWYYDTNGKRVEFKGGLKFSLR